MEDKEMNEEEYPDNLLMQASAEAPESASFSQGADSGDSAEKAEVPKEAAVPDFDIDAFIAGMAEEEEQLPDINSEQPGQTAEAKDNPDISTEDYHRPLDMVIDEIENDRHAKVTNAADLSGNTGISAEELNEAGRDEEDSSLMEAVGLLMGEEAGKRADNNEFSADGFNFDDLYDVDRKSVV